MGLFGKHKEDKNGETMPVAAPPMPPIAETEAKEESNSNMLSAPVMPGQGLDDIKSQVTGNDILEPSNQDAETSNDVDFSSNNRDLSSNTDFNIDDSLFDFSDVEASNLNESQNEISQLSGTDLVDPNGKNISTLNFVNNSNNHSSVSKEESFFVTTSQFKTLLELVDSVKERIKNSTDSHLRLLDIKSEEDIEYENLRKDFQFVENKLYELDGIIFDK